MREAASKWDGRSLLRPNVEYNNWDADQIQGCVCDEGYSGYDCSIVECPRGDDPKTVGQVNEFIQVSCLADGGYWFLSFRGATTRPIPYDAGYGTVERILESMGTMDDVSVTYSDMVGLAPACGATTANVITIEFLQDNGPQSIARVDGSRLTLNAGSSQGILNMLTTYKLICEGNVNRGVFYLIYDDDISNAISYQANEQDLMLKLRQIKALGSSSNNPYGNVSISLSFNGGGSSNQVCSSSGGGGAKSITNITIAATYGNLLPITVISSLIDDQGETGNVNLTVEEPFRGTKENIMCNNHGECDTTTGTCRCSQRVTPGTTSFLYRYTSSDGEGNLGTKGDCGYEFLDSITCPYGIISGSQYELCSNRGICINSTKTCECYEGFYGSACSHRTCPKGNAWFDEATSTNKAHALAECSNRGLCDSTTGQCLCDPNFEGASCERIRCASTVNGDECSGHGRCLPMWRLALEAQDKQGSPLRLSYGDSDDEFNLNRLWDRDQMHGCHCDTRNDLQPYNGPKSHISGIYVDNPKVGGWSGYDCSRKWCPTGDDPLASGSFEEQTILCKNNTGNFTVSFRGVISDPISPSANASEFKEVLEGLTTIGEVDVTFPSSGANLTVCHSSYGFIPTNNTLRGVVVKFYSELGDLPMLHVRTAIEPKRDIQVNETVRGTKVNAECSNRGMCDYNTGSCMCLPGFGGSAGNESSGLRRDCGRRSDNGFTLNPFYKEN
eukprot:CAMPEP_0114354738 /NCGR_PEP_ID=MMETSP0101-20121206/19708_1 /TAXON_ID=38822 ORGANISM="Pteridomonas danica, Strain PT" /NCGR_SAMPLE_ID=MMETSP0101 /ASSEMBLY_ACC=CAM_ASM_000211 /LENGTH=727 /DNA_ID=CAMNT_0001496363 /DNA_START=304 /DNA_END=2487 /DNA_ORIENTATION=+